MALGMGVVFVFLLLLVAVMNVTSLILRPREQPMVTAVPAHHLAVVAAAVRAHRTRRRG